MPTIDISFTTWKTLTQMRTTEETSEDDIIQQLMRAAPAQQAMSPQGTPDSAHDMGWNSQGVTLAEGTVLTGHLWGQMYQAQVRGGRIWYNGESYKTPSGAARSISRHGVNGWKFWTVMHTLPGNLGPTPVTLDTLRTCIAAAA